VFGAENCGWLNASDASARSSKFSFSCNRKPLYSARFARHLLDEGRRRLAGFDLIRQWMRKIANSHEGKPYAEHVPFERIFNGDIQIVPIGNIEVNENMEFASPP
jgi:hypothetical protein